MSKTKLAGASLVVGGAALVGAMVGRDLGPIRLELSQDQVTTVLAGFGAILALVGCAFTIERSEARARTRQTILRLEWMLFRTKEKADSEKSESFLDGPNVTSSPRPVQVAGSRAGCTLSGTLR